MNNAIPDIRFSEAGVPKASALVTQEILNR